MVLNFFSIIFFLSGQEQIKVKTANLFVFKMSNCNTTAGFTFLNTFRGFLVMAQPIKKEAQVINALIAIADNHVFMNQT